MYCCGVYLDLDCAWETPPLRLQLINARRWGCVLRCFAPRVWMRAFIEEVARDLPPFVLYGSGDFHHVTAALIGNSTASTVVVFDNHPDWDRRPPHWSCGGWVNRALELPHVRRLSVWGLGNFELSWPIRVFGNHRVEVHAWKERYPRHGTMTVADWRSQFESFAKSIDGPVYVSVDMDCLQDAITNWENGLFTADDVAWAVRQLKNVVAGDLCGAYSPPVYGRTLQRFAADWDHPRLSPRDLPMARAVNAKFVEAIWPALSR